MTRPRRLGGARPVEVREGAGGIPGAVDGRAVEGVLEGWVVEDRWWTGRPVRRRYFEVVIAGGRCRVVFRDLRSGVWYSQVA